MVCGAPRGGAYLPRTLYHVMLPAANICSMVALTALCLMLGELGRVQEAHAQEAEASAQQSASAPDHGLFVSVGADGASTVTPGLGWHGYALIHYRRRGLWRGAQLDAFYNTDTLYASVSGIALTDKLRLGAYTKAQAVGAGVLFDYYQLNRSLPERSFGASYAQAVVVLELSDAPLFLQLELGGRRWAFSALEGTSPALTLPADMWTFEPRLRATWWSFQHDRAFSEPHRHTWRTRGWGFGLEFGQDLRAGWRPWGALDPDVFEEVDRRNVSGRQPLLFRGWLRAGQPLGGGRLRLQQHLFVALGDQEDDLTRVRLGGMNPYVVSLAGMPWAAFLPENFGAAQVSLMARVTGESEAGVFLDAARISEADARRVGRQGAPNELLGVGLYGVGLAGDVRLGEVWQLDLRAGWTLPNDTLGNSQPNLSAWLSLGAQVF